MSVSLTMRPPYILVVGSVSIQELGNVNRFGVWAEVIEINSSTTGIAVGDIVYYLQDSAPTIVDTKDNTYYYVVDENKVMFIEL